MQTAAVTKLLSSEDLQSLGGAIAVTVVVTNTICYLFNLGNKYVGFIVSMTVAVVGLVFSNSYTIENVIMCVLNSFVIYAGATGVSGIVAGSRNNQSALPDSTDQDPHNTTNDDISMVEESMKGRKKFFRRWY